MIQVDEYITLLNRLYLKSPARVLFVISQNKAYQDDKATKRIFPDLLSLVSGRFEKRKNKWYRERYRILSTLVCDGIADMEDYRLFCGNRRRKIYEVFK